MINDKKLFFALGNAKVGPNIWIFSLPAGHSCFLFADKCLAFANRQTGKITDGVNQEFRCYAASQEALYPNLRKRLHDNFDILKSCKTSTEMYRKIDESLPKYHGITIRWHADGEFFSYDYFLAFLKICQNNPKIKFYAYTKALPFWVANLGNIPKNCVLTASRGGKFDHLIDQYKLKTAEVVNSMYSAKKKGLKLDFTDGLAQSNNRKFKKFALLLHGTQKAKTVASKAWSRIKRTVGGYS